MLTFLAIGAWFRNWAREGGSRKSERELQRRDSQAFSCRDSILRFDFPACFRSPVSTVEKLSRVHTLNDWEKRSGRFRFGRETGGGNCVNFPTLAWKMQRHFVRGLWAGALGSAARTRSKVEKFLKKVLSCENFSFLPPDRSRGAGQRGQDRAWQVVQRRDSLCGEKCGIGSGNSPRRRSRRKPPDSPSRERGAFRVPGGSPRISAGSPGSGGGQSFDAPNLKRSRRRREGESIPLQKTCFARNWKGRIMQSSFTSIIIWQSGQSEILFKITKTDLSLSCRRFIRFNAWSTLSPSPVSLDYSINFHDWSSFFAILRH